MTNQERKAVVTTLEDVRIGFRNFKGAEGMYNKEGDRNFVIFLDDETARKMEDDGWAIKWPKEREATHDEEDQRSPYLPVNVTYKAVPPKVVLMGEGIPPRDLDESTIETLDYVKMNMVDLTIRPYYWSMNNKKGIKAYLRDMYVTMETDPLMIKYGL